MGRATERLVLELHWLLEAAPDRIFRMLTDPVLLVQWWGPAGFTTPEIEWQARAGARYRLGMQPPEGELFHLSGEFLEVRPPSRLVYTFRWDEPDPDDRETTVALSVSAFCDASKLSLSQGDFTTDARLALHERGWTESIEKLRRLVGTEP